MAADMCHVDVTGVHLISIHAPPRGATAISRGQIASKSFQFPPLCEGRRHGSDPAPPSCHFNSRPSARGDLIQARMPISGQGISIHAPPRGATNSHHIPCTCNAFQFTPLREGRHQQLQNCQVYSDFNSRPSARGDSKRYAISANLLSNPHKLPCFSSRAM